VDVSVGRAPTAHEYGRIDVAPADVVGADGRLLLLPGVLNNYVRVDYRDGELRVSALGYCGLIPLTATMSVAVRPRFPLRNLSRMVAACGYPPAVVQVLRGYATTDGRDDWLVDVLADALLDEFEVISGEGLLRKYVERSDSSTAPHGRIAAGRTMSSFVSRGITYKAHHSWWERTADNPENRVIRAAFSWLHQHYVRAERRSGVRHRISRIATALHRLAEVSADRRLDCLTDPVVRGARPLPQTRAYYRGALDLAVLIVLNRGVSLEGPGGALLLPSLLIKTEDLFEDYVRQRLQASFPGRGDLELLDGNTTGRVTLFEDLEEQQVVALGGLGIPLPPSGAYAKPDLVLRSPRGTYPLVGDVKYTAVTPATGRDAVEQVILYGQRYRSPITMTVHPRQSNQTGGLHIAGRVGGTLVAQYRVDLDAEDLDAEVDEMAAVIRRLLDVYPPR